MLRKPMIGTWLAKLCLKHKLRAVNDRRKKRWLSKKKKKKCYFGF